MPSKLTKNKLTRLGTRPTSRAIARKSTRLGSRLVQSSSQSSVAGGNLVFIPLLIVCLLVWLIYRLVFSFPIWFDESIGKALFFGLPVWLYISITGDRVIPETFAPRKIRSGLLLGIAVGGLYGFAVSFLSLFRPGIVVIPVPLFSSPDFWGEFILAVLTGFWETLFFYSWIMTTVFQKYAHKSLFYQLVLVASIFLVFHLPNIVLRTGWGSLFSFGPLLFLFALGQALLFLQNRNGYTLAMSQAIWGLALLIHLK